MESFGDKTRAFVYALLVHLACIAVMFVGLFWTKSTTPASIPGPIIEAELVGLTAAPPHVAPQKPKPAPPKPVEKPPEKPPEKPIEKPPEPQPTEPPRNDAIDREKIAELALLKAEQQKKAEEEKRRREQTLLEDQQRERAKQIEEIKHQRELAEKKRKLEQEKLAQLQDLNKAKPQKPQPEAPPAEQARTGANGTDNSLLGEYSAALVNVIKLNWNRPDNAQPGLRCTLKVVQLPGGDVMSVKAVAPCNADQVTRASIEEAVTKAQPLPYKGYEKVFARELTLIFYYDGN